MILHKQDLSTNYLALCNKLTNKFTNFLIIITLFTSIFAVQVSAKEINIKEYGIVILPEDRCVKKAEISNISIKKLFNNLKTVKNYWHVTLYHGAYEINDLSKIYNKLKELQLRPFTLNFSKIYSTADRWIDLGVEKTIHLQNLHTSAVLLASPYHKRPLARSTDVYKDMTIDQREQVDSYGVSGILSSYNPHMTLYYQYPPNSELQQAALEMESNAKINMVCKASRIVLGELGYNGNVEKIIYSINIPD